MIKPAVFCIAFSRLQADQMIQRLRAAALPVQDISILFASGPMIAALGDLTQGFMNQGVPLYKARLYEVSIREGHSLVSVLAESESKKALAQEIFSRTGGNDIWITGESSTSYEPSSTSQLVKMTSEHVGVA